MDSIFHISSLTAEETCSYLGINTIYFNWLLWNMMFSIHLQLGEYKKKDKKRSILKR